MVGINQNRATPDESSPWKLNGIIVGLNKYASVNPGINEWDLRKINKYSCTSTTVASLPTFPAEPTYVREFRDFCKLRDQLYVTYQHRSTLKGWVVYVVD